MPHTTPAAEIISYRDANAEISRSSVVFHPTPPTAALAIRLGATRKVRFWAPKDTNTIPKSLTHKFLYEDLSVHGNVVDVRQSRNNANVISSYVLLPFSPSIPY